MKIPDEMNVWEGFGVYLCDSAIYEALAEECSELTHAALKMARVLRGENPTPVSEAEAMEMVVEELTDVISCVIALWLNVDPEQAIAKFERMQRRCYERSPWAKWD